MNAPKALKYNAKFWDGKKNCEAKISKGVWNSSAHNPFYEVLTGEHKGSLVHVFDIKEKTLV